MEFVIGDGDNSVHPTLIQNVPGWGFAINKIECANHACKCYRGALEQLVKNNPSYKGTRGPTVKMRRRLVSAARCAIRMRSRESDTKKALTSLRKDLANGPRHCFGIHTQCNPDFCTTARGMAQQGSSSGSGSGDCEEERHGGADGGCGGAGGEDHTDSESDIEGNVTPAKSNSHRHRYLVRTMARG